MPKMKCEKRMKTFMSRVAISVALAAVAIVVRWKGCTQQPADDLVVGTAGPTFERPHDPPPPPSPQPTNAVGGQARQMHPVVAAARALRTVSSQAQ